MVNAPHLLYGIQLVQAGRKGDALNHLRHAVQSEAVTAEGWLWLAAATGDLDEYRYCVEQALLLEPNHPVAWQMRHELERRGQWSFYADYTGRWEQDSGAGRHRPARGWRVLRLVIVLLVMGGVVGGAAALILSGTIQEKVREWLPLEETHTLEFTIGELPPYRFRVELPETWFPADKDNPSWRDRRDQLITAFPAPDGQTSVWEQVETSFSQAVRDPVYGDLKPPIRLVETDATRLAEDGIVAALTLDKIEPFPAPPPGETVGDVCTRMRLLEQETKANGGLAAQPDSAIIETILAARHDLGDCIYVVHRRYTNQTAAQAAFPLDPAGAPFTTREIMLFVAVGPERYAAWQITLADSAYDDYEHTLERIYSTLVYQAR